MIDSLLYPMFAMVLVTYTVLFVSFIWRVQAVRSKQVPIKYFKVFEGVDAPQHILASTRQYANLFELPVLFYAACITGLVLEVEADWMVWLAWLFVVARIAHAIIHMGRNHILQRIIAFWCGSIIVLSMWVGLIFVRF